MLGALFQMLPVIAGVVIETPVTLALRTQYLLLLGTIFLLLTFAKGGTALPAAAAFFLTAALLPPIFQILRRLLKLPSHSSSSRGMGFALFNLTVLLLLGLSMLGMRGGIDLGDYAALKSVHLAFGLYGWIALLIVSISFQVIEMFYVTPAYPKPVGRSLPFGISALLTGELIAALFAPALISWIEVSIALALLGYALLTLRRLSQRQRPLADATVWFWRVGMGSLALSMALQLCSELTACPGTLQAIIETLYATFALSILFAMSYKIVPFLTWFHLNAQGYFTAPMMHEVIHPRYAMRHLALHLTTLFSALFSSVDSRLWPLTGLLLVGSFLWLALAIYRAWHLYLDVRENGERIDMGSFGASY